MTAQQLDLPLPDADALASSQTLVERIRMEILDHDGRISFARYMELALYTPSLGYYSGGCQKFGVAGDFITAPEISSMFSECLSHQIRQVLTGLAVSDKAYILEVGAGSGQMAADILTSLEQHGVLPVQYLILELSAELKQRQYETLQKLAPQLLSRVVWIEQLPEPGFCGVVVANELLDAMPVHKFLFKENRLHECYVTWADNHLEWVLGDVSSPDIELRVTSFQNDFVAGYTSEVNLAASAWIHTVGRCLSRGMILIIDYGYPRREYYHAQRISGTLMCHYRHRMHDDPLVYPGLQDITAHIDFTAIAESALNADLTISGYTTQAHFLLDCGLADVAEKRFSEDTKQQITISTQIKKLTLPNEMGEVVKVMALTRDYSTALMGFRTQDLRAKL